MLRVIARNAASNWLGYAVQVVVTFFLTPFVLKSLGDTRYGIWALITGLTGYYGLLALGLQAGVTQLMTHSIAEKDYDKLNRITSAAVFALTVCSIFVILAATIVAFFAPSLFTVDESQATEMRACILLVGLNTAAQFVLFPYSAIFAATQRYDASNLIGIATRILTATATVVCLTLGYGLIGLAAVITVGDVVSNIVRYRVAYHIVPQLRVSLALARDYSYSHILSITGWNAIVQLSVQTINYSSRIIIGICMPMAALAPFSLAVSLTDYAYQMLYAITVVLFPAAAGLYAQGDESRLQTLFLNGSRLLTVLSLAGAMITFVWADDFFMLWIGSDVGSLDGSSPPAAIFRILVIGFVLAAAPRIGSQILLACKRLPFLALLSCGEAVLSTLLALVLIRTFGLTGVAWSIVISAGVVRAFAMSVVVCRVLSVPFSQYLGTLLFRPGVFAVLFAAMLACIRFAWPNTTSWLALSVSGATSAVAAGGLSLAIGLTHGERQQYVFGPARSLKKLVSLRSIAHSQDSTNT